MRSLGQIAKMNAQCEADERKKHADKLQQEERDMNKRPALQISTADLIDELTARGYTVRPC